MKKLHFCLIIAVIALAGCTGRNDLEVKPLNFTDQIDQFQNLEFGFNQEIAPDSLIGIWDSTEYIKFVPEIPGKFQWTDKKTLIFSPYGAFAANTDYKATFTNKITDLSEERKGFKDESITFHTPYLELLNGYAYWSRNDQSSDQIELHIHATFNYAIEPTNAATYLELKINGTVVPIELRSNEASSDLEIITSYNTVNEKVSEISLTMLPGMQSVGSDHKSTDPLSIEITVPPVNLLEIIDITTGFEESKGVITVYTSQPVIRSGIESHVRVDSSVAYQVSMISNGFKIKGDFAEGNTYQLTLKRSLKGVFGPELGEDATREVSFGSLRPYIEFADKTGIYLTPDGESNIGLNLINVPEVKVTVFKIFENNIQHFIRNGRQWNWYGDEEGYYESYNYQLDEDYGQIVSVRKYLTSNLPKNGNLRLLKIHDTDLDLAGERKGIFLIKAESIDKAWLNDVQLISYSDIGLIVHAGADEIFVSATSIASAEPLQGVTINFHSRNNQLVHREVTGTDGIAIFKNIKETIPDFKVSMITARRGEDFNVLLFNQSAVEMSRFETGGKHTTGIDYDAFIYGDRNLYRPGDSVFCNAVLRDFNMKTATGFPVIFRVISPNGKDFLKRRVNVNSEGSALLSFLLPAKAYTGVYTIEVLTVNNVLQASYRIKVEEFMPDRISVTIRTDKSNYQPGEKLQLNVQAQNLSGTPASARNVESEMRITRKAFRADSYKDYSFNLTGKEELDIISTVAQTVTSAKGEATQEFQLPEAKNNGLLQGRIFTTVFDETGRPVNRTLTFDLYTQQSFLGMSQLPYWLSTGRPLKVNLIALNPKQQSLATKAKFEVVMVEWETVLEKNFGQLSYRSQRREVVVHSQNVSIPVNGTSVNYTPNASGEYIIRVSLPESNTWLEHSFYAYKYGDSNESSFRVNKDGQIDITFDKKIYAPGDEASILFKTPFAGELLITVEQNSVLSYYRIKADNNGASLKLKVTGNFVPNVWITATLLRKMDASGIPLTVAHGFESMQVEKPSNKLPVVITAPKQIRSNTTQEITIKTKPLAEVTIAVVDEGILQITDYKSPDPYGYFYGKRALEVKAYDLFDELLPELSSNRSSTGGDQGFDLGKRLNPMTAKRVKLLSLWSGRLRSDATGMVKFLVNIPQFNGAVRIMAVAYKDEQFGSSDMSMRVTDPLNITSSLPRFLSPGDKALVDVTLENTTAKSMTVNVHITTNGLQGNKAPFMAGKPKVSRVTIPANSEQRLSYELTALNMVGSGNVIFKATSSGEAFSETTELGVRPPVPLVKKAIAGDISAGKTVTVKSEIESIPGTETSSLLITTNPAGQFAEHLEALINYPYGCLEQSISAVFPQLYFKDLAKLLRKGSIPGSELSPLFIKEAMRKIAAAQQYNGGLVMWPSGGNINWWTTAYAAHFLYEAERAGFEADKSVTDGILDYLTTKVKERHYENYYYTDYTSGQWIKRTMPSKENFYSLFVLALHGRQHMPTMNYFKSRLNELGTEDRFLLAAAYRLSGDEKNYETIVPKSWEGVQIENMTGGSFNSPIRDRALALYTLLVVDKNNPMIGVLSRQLGEMVRERNWMSTQERVFTMLSFGKMAAGSDNKGKTTATITSGNKTYEFDGEDRHITLADSKANISVKGNAKVYWFLESEGLPLSMQVKEEDRILKVRRNIYNRSGQLLSGSSYSQNDLLVVAVSVSTTDNSTVHNVVITDMLPACFEIENTRLTDDRQMKWISQNAQPDYTDIRDDRINFFTSASGTPKTFYYTVRVVSKGTYIQGPVGAEAMYNGQYYSYYGKRQVSSL